MPSISERISGLREWFLQKVFALAVLHPFLDFFLLIILHKNQHLKERPLSKKIYWNFPEIFPPDDLQVNNFLLYLRIENTGYKIFDFYFWRIYTFWDVLETILLFWEILCIFLSAKQVLYSLYNSRINARNFVKFYI